MIESSSEFVRLRYSENLEDCRKASWGEASIDTWMEVIDHYPELRVAVAHNKTIPEVVVRKLFAEHYEAVKSTLARKRRLPKDLMQALAMDSDEGVRMSIARHPKVTMKALAVLRNDSWEEIRNVVEKRIREFSV